MTLTFILILLGASVATFFSEEFGRLFKKILSTPGINLLLPLILASCLVVTTKDNWFWLFSGCQAMLNHLVGMAASYFPFEPVVVGLINIAYLMLIVSIPGWIYKARPGQKNTYESPPSFFLLCLILWIVAAIVLVVFNKT